VGLKNIFKPLRAYLDPIDRATQMFTIVKSLGGVMGGSRKA
jgi:hypothetical protein